MPKKKHSLVHRKQNFQYTLLCKKTISPKQEKYNLSKTKTFTILCKTKTFTRLVKDSVVHGLLKYFVLHVLSNDFVMNG